MIVNYENLNEFFNFEKSIFQKQGFIEVSKILSLKNVESGRVRSGREDEKLISS